MDAAYLQLRPQTGATDEVKLPGHEHQVVKVAMPTRAFVCVAHTPCCAQTDKWGLGRGCVGYKSRCHVQPAAEMSRRCRCQVHLYIQSYPILSFPLSCHGSWATLKWLPASALFALPRASWQNCWKK